MAKQDEKDNDSSLERVVILTSAEEESSRKIATVTYAKEHANRKVA